MPGRPVPRSRISRVLLSRQPELFASFMFWPRRELPVPSGERQGTEVPRQALAAASVRGAGALPAVRGPAGLGAGRALSCQSCAWQGVTASPLLRDLRYVRRFLVAKSVCEPKVGVGSRGMRGAGEPLLLPSGQGRGSGQLREVWWQLFHHLHVAVPGTFSGCSAAGGAPSRLSLCVLRSTLFPGMCTVIVAGYFPTPTSSFRHSLNYLKMTGAYRAGSLLLCYSLGSPKLHGSCFSTGSRNTLIFSLQFVLMLKK